MNTPRDFGQIAEQLRRSTVQLTHGRGRNRGSGSGVIWTHDGLIITNAHVATQPATTVQLWDGRTLPGEVLHRDPQRDLASVRIQATQLPAATPANSALLRPGELVVAIGNPMGFIGALTTGVVHANAPVPTLGPQPWVQAAVRLAPGNSGGPLANAQGHVIGINTMVVQGNFAGGLGLAVPSNAVADFLKRTQTPRPILGITARQVQTGLLVLEVNPAGPAAAASIIMGDVITAVEPTPSPGLYHLRFRRGTNPTERQVAVRAVAPSEKAA